MDARPEVRLRRVTTQPTTVAEVTSRARIDLPGRGRNDSLAGPRQG